MWVAELESFDTVQGRSRAGEELESLLFNAIAVDGRFGGEFTTPQPVVDLMVELVDPRPGDRIYDPCFGVGGTLVTAARRIRSNAQLVAPRTWTSIQENGIFGVELNPLPFVIGLCRILLAGISRPGLELGDALERAAPRNRSTEGFDCVLASPPWGGRRERYNLDPHFHVPTSDTESLFLQHVMQHLRPGGRAVVVLPNGPLFRRGRHVELRRLLIDQFRLEGVISLPEGTFSPFTSIQANLVVFSRHEPSKTVRFMKIEREHAVDLEAGEAPGSLEDSPARIAKTFRTGATGSGLWETSVQLLAAREYELLAKRSGAEELDEVLDRIRLADPSIPVLPIEKIADLITGFSYEGKYTSKRVHGEDVVAGLIRVGDVTERGVREPTLALSHGGELRLRKEHYLGRGDIVVTRSGTVGKVSMVSADLENAVATKGLTVIRCHDGVLPEFLSALLRAPAYHAWFSGHASGSTIQHLPTKIARKVMVPVPPVAIQDAVAREGAGRKADALAVLLRMISGATRSPITRWLEDSSLSVLFDETALTPAGRLARFAEGLVGLYETTTADESDASEARSWLLAMKRPASILAGIETVPPGSARLAALELARLRIDTARAELEPTDTPISSRLRGVAANLLELIDAEIAGALKTVSVLVSASPKSVAVGVLSEVRIQVRNASLIGLRNVEAVTIPDCGTGTFAYLPEGSTSDFPITVKAAESGSTLMIGVDWHAVRLDGVPIRGHVDVPLLVQSTRDSSRASEELGPSPYIVANPVDRDEMFFGRADILALIRGHLNRAGQANVILLEGNRRTGKTSILRQLRKSEALPGWIPIYCSFQDAEGDDSRAGIKTKDVYRLLARVIGWSLYDAGVKTWLPDSPPYDPKQPFKTAFRKELNRAFSEEHPFEIFEMYLAGALQAAEPRRILLMLDEFDKLQEGIDAGITSPQVPENIRYLLQQYPAFSAILTGSRRLKRLREEYWSALFGLGYRVGVSALPLEDARRLVTDPVAGRLAYLPQARDHVVTLCARQPFLIQSLCQRVFERANTSEERTITDQAVDEAAQEMVRDNEHFRTLWGYAATERRRLLLALCERLSQGPDPVNLALLATKLEDLGVRVRRESVLADDIAYLRELEMVEFDESYRGGTYRIAVPLLATWIKTAIDFDEALLRAKEEAEEVTP